MRSCCSCCPEEVTYLGVVVQDKTHLTMQTAPTCRNKWNKGKTSFSSANPLLTYEWAHAVRVLSKCLIGPQRFSRWGEHRKECRKRNEFSIAHLQWLGPG